MRAARQRRADVTMLSQGSPAAVGSFDDKRDMAQQGCNLAIPDDPAALDDAVKAAVDAAKGAADATPTVLDAASAAAGAAPAAADSTTATALAQIAAGAQKEVAQITAGRRGCTRSRNHCTCTERGCTNHCRRGAAHVAQITTDGADKVAHTSGDALRLSSTINAAALIFVAIAMIVGMAVSSVSNDDPIRTKVKQLTPPRWSEANDAKSLYASVPTSWTKTLPSENDGEDSYQNCTPIVDKRDVNDRNIKIYTPPSGNENVNASGSNDPERFSTNKD